MWDAPRFFYKKRARLQERARLRYLWYSLLLV